MDPITITVLLTLGTVIAAVATVVVVWKTVAAVRRAIARPYVDVALREVQQRHEQEIHRVHEISESRVRGAIEGSAGMLDIAMQRSYDQMCHERDARMLAEMRAMLHDDPPQPGRRRVPNVATRSVGVTPARPMKMLPTPSASGRTINSLFRSIFARKS